MLQIHFLGLESSDMGETPVSTEMTNAAVEVVDLTSKTTTSTGNAITNADGQLINRSHRYYSQAGDFAFCRWKRIGQYKLVI